MLCFLTWKFPKLHERMRFSTLLATLVATAETHSWLLQIGDRGIKRGGLVGTDDDKTRYYCPFTDFSKCIALTSTVVLPPDSNRPCSPGMSNPMGIAVAGAPLFVAWQGNGHVGKADDSCVKIAITPYAADPGISAFTTLVDCVPFNHGWSPDTTVTIPATTKPGNYTLFWVWSYAQFYYSSCADIVVMSSSGTPHVTVPKISIGSALAISYDELDCGTIVDPDGFCITKFGPGSYCKTYTKDACGRSHCQGYPPLGGCDSESSGPYHNATNPVMSPTMATDPVIPASEKALPYDTTDCKSTSSPDAWCRAMVGSHSYCKSWAQDACGRSRCFGRSPTVEPDCSKGTALVTLPLTRPLPASKKGCEGAPDPASYCKIMFGATSYCKLNQKDVCGRSWCFGQTQVPPCK